MKSIDEAKQSNYRYLPPKNELYSPDLPIITIIIDCYYKLDLVKQSVQSILNQDYHNVELLLIDNGAEDLVSDYIRQVYEKDKNIALIKFKVNQFSWEDVLKVVTVCWNSGVLHSRGDIIGHLSYDDMLSLNCVDRMAKLFIENDKCVTAAPLPVSIDINGNVNAHLDFSKSNSRPRYIDGKELALNLIEGNKRSLFSAPGGVLFIRKDIIIETGGFDRAADTTQLVKFAVNGDSGFDPQARLFWRHHGDQLNKLAKKKGLVECNSLKDVIKNDGVVEIWTKLFTKKQVNSLHKFVKLQSINEGITVSTEALRDKNIIRFFVSLRNVIRKCPATFFHVIFFSFLEIVKMFFEKISKYR
jgi:glycosyltransferase involved in cell wall biosynthesis